MIALFVAVALESRAHAIVFCTPLPTCGDAGVSPPCATPTPTVAWDFDPTYPVIQLDHFTVYAKDHDVATWEWQFVIPVIHAGCNPVDPLDCWPDWIPGTLDFPAQRVPAVDTSKESIDFMVTASDIWNQESGPSNLITACLPEVWKCCEHYN